MKKLILTPVLAFLFVLSNALTAQSHPEEYLGLPGDNLNLYAVMNLFQESETLEAFERNLNDPENMINNLDLNGDNYVDYIMVFDYKQGDIHSIVLRVALNQNDYQDVAVFTVERFRNGSVQVQLIGDEALYGPNYIIEPMYAETPNPGYRSTVNQQNASARKNNVTVVQTNYYEVARWPVVTYIYRPNYRVYRSSWHWGYYPGYWAPRTPHYWHYYYGYHYNWHSHYYAYYRPWRHHRSVHYHTVYHTQIRNYSPTVVVNINKGSYRDTYTRPESRRDGEVLYTQRHSSGSTVPAGTRTSGETRGRENVRTSSDVNNRSAGTNNTRRTEAAGRTERSEASARQASARQSSQNERSENTRARATSNTTERNNTRERVAAPQRQPAATTPARDVRTREGSAGSNRPAVQNTPARTNNSTQSAPAVRTQPARTNSQPATQARPAAQTNTRNTATSVQRGTGTQRNAGTSVQSSSNTRNRGTSVQRNTSNNRNSGTSVQRSSGNNRSAATSVQRSSNNTRSSNPDTNNNSRNQRR